MAHLPPKTSGLFHIGQDSTIILPPTQQDSTSFVLENMSSNRIEDTLSKTFTCQEYNLDQHSIVWDINLNHDHSTTLSTSNTTTTNTTTTPNTK